MGSPPSSSGKSGQRGGVPTPAGVSIDPAAAVFFLDNTSAICGGFIGRPGTRFCGLPSAECTVPGHAKKFDLTPRTFYISCPPGRGVPRGALFCSPSFTGDKNSLPTEVLDWLYASHPLSVKKRGFALLEQADGADLTHTTAKALTVRATRKGGPLLNQGPDVKRQRLVDRFSAPDVLDLSVSLDPGPDFEDVTSEEYPGLFLSHLWPKLKNYLQQNQEAQAAQLSDVDSLFEVQSKLKRTLEDLQLDLRSAVGTLLPDEGDLASTVRTVGGELETLTRLLDPEAVQELSVRIQDMEDLLADPSEGWNVTKEALVKIINSLAALESQSLHARMTILEGKKDTGLVAPPGQSAHASTQQFEFLLKRVQDMEGKLTDTAAFQMGRVSFRSVQEVEDWLRDNKPRSDLSLGWVDPYSIAEIARGQAVSEEKLKAAKRLKDGGITGVSVNEGLILVSFGILYPICFGKPDREVKGKNMNELPGCKTYNEWYDDDSAIMSISRTLELGCEEYRKTVLESELSSIQWNLPEQLPLLKLAEGLLAATESFISHLTRESAKLYRELTGTYGATEKDAWVMVSDMLAAVWRECSEARKVSGDPLSTADPIQRSARVLWGAWNCHRIMHDVRTIGFRHHSCILPAQTNGLYRMKASASDVSTLKASVKDLEGKVRGASEAGRGVSQSKVDSLESDLRKAEAKNKSLYEAHEALKKKHNALYEEVKKIKEKL